jgi:protein ImuB
MSARVLPLPLPAPLPPAAAVVRQVPVTQEPAPPVAKKRRAVWLAIHLHGWQLHAALAGLSDKERAVLSAQPLAIVEADRRATLVACNSLAHDRGVRPGHSLNASIALCAQTQFLPRDLSSEGSLLESLASHCERYTSTVSVEQPNELLLEIRGSIKLFGGIEALIDRIRCDLSELGLTPRLAVAPTAQSSLWLSRIATKPIVVKPRTLLPAIGRLPVAYLCWPPDIELRLARFGVLTISDLLRLPRAGLSRRIGHERLAELDRAVGRHREVRRNHRSTQTYRDRVHLDFEIETTGLLSAVIHKRFERLSRYLIQRTLATDRVYIDLRHRERDPTRVVIGLACATSETSHIAKLMHEQLAKLELPAPVKELLIRADRLVPQPSRSRELFGRQLLESIATSTEAQARLLEQLSSRLGSEAVQQIAVHADYRPECANQIELATVTSTALTPEIPASLAPRPLWLLPAPKALRNNRKVTVIRGPEAIEAGWWDGVAVLRNYFHVKSSRGAHAWIFCSGEEPQHRFIQGLFG